MCSRFTNGPAMMFTPCCLAMFGICGPISSSNALTLALLRGQVSGEWVPRTTKCMASPGFVSAYSASFARRQCLAVLISQERWRGVVSVHAHHRDLQELCRHG